MPIRVVAQEALQPAPTNETMELNSLHELYVDELKDLYSAENQILKALPRMMKAATHPQLKRAFQLHERQTREQVKRLERIMKGLGERPGGKKCHGMEGLIEEGKELIKERPHPDVLDAGLISKAQHVEHYEIAGYGTVRTYARLLGREEDARLLQMTLDEEGETDKLLTGLAESGINLEAEQAEDEAEDARPRKRGAAKKGGARKGGRKTARSR
jgi:ferritin-like metal-binding protein YciE